MQLPVFCHKDFLDPVHTPDQLHPVFKTKDIADCAQGISVHGPVRDDRYLIQVVLHRISGIGIQDVMVDRAVFLKIPFVISG